MADLETYISEIESNLKAEKYGKAISKIKKLKRDFPDYKWHANGYLIDYFLAQAYFRQAIDQKKFSVEDIDRIIKLFSSSLSLNESFADCHFLLGYAFMIRSKLTLTADEKNEFDNKAAYHMKKAKELNPALAEECDKNLLVIQMKQNIS